MSSSNASAASRAAAVRCCVRLAPPAEGAAETTPSNGNNTRNDVRNTGTNDVVDLGILDV